MSQISKMAVVGALALAGSVMASVDVQAMPLQDLSAAASSTAPSIDKVWWRGGWGWRGGYGYRGYGWGYRRPFYGYGFGWRRPFYGPYYGWRRW